MPVVIEQCYTVSFDDGAKWKIKSDSVRSIEGVTYVKIMPYCQSFIRFIVDGAFKLPTTVKMSLAGTDGYMELIKLRNSASKCLHDELNSDASASADHQDLFAVADASQPKKKRLSVAQLREIRSAPTHIEFTVPGIGGAQPLDVGSIRAAHPEDNMWIRFDEDTLAHVVRYLRVSVTDAECLQQRREYKSNTALPSGVWRNGGNKLVYRVKEKPAEKRAVLAEDPSQSILPWAAPAQKKWKVFKDVDADVEVTADADARTAGA